jgi:hypothetical protein
MKRQLTILAVASLLGGGGCLGEAGSLGATEDQGATPPAHADAGTQPSSDPFAPCVDPLTCCTQNDMECSGDPDNNPVCKCWKLWDCSENPKKCEQDTIVPPGGGSWECTWTSTSYICKGGNGQNLPPPSGGGNWSCSWSEGQGVWVCNRTTPPNPSNTPAGNAVWKCTVAGGKIVCERAEPKPDAGAPKPDLLVPPKQLDSGIPQPDKPLPPATPKTESNCSDGIDNDQDGKTDCKDSDCPACPPPSVNGEICDGKDNNGDGKIDEGNVCQGVGEPCPPGAYQSCDCYCGVHRKCKADGTWGPCKVDGNKTCAIAQITSQSQCGFGTFCDYGKCVVGFALGNCKHHSDCKNGQVCDLGWCVKDNYFPCP